MEVYYEDIKMKRVKKKILKIPIWIIISLIIALIIFLIFLSFYRKHSDLIFENQIKTMEITELQKIAQRLYTNNENLKLILEDYDKLTWDMKKEIDRLIIYQKNMERKLKQAGGRQ